MIGLWTKEFSFPLSVVFMYLISARVSICFGVICTMNFFKKRQTCKEKCTLCIDYDLNHLKWFCKNPRRVLCSVTTLSIGNGHLGWPDGENEKLESSGIIRTKGYNEKCLSCPASSPVLTEVFSVLNYNTVVQFV